MRAVRTQKAKRKRQRAKPLGFDFTALSAGLGISLPSALCLGALVVQYFGPFAAMGVAQQAPYAAIDRAAVSYNGPGRDIGHDLKGSEIHIGLLAPFAGPREAEGEALRHAAEMAIEQDNAASLPGGRRLALVARDESGPWGRASNEIVHMVFDDQAVAVITSTDGASAHLAEQVGNKLGVPILTLSTDETTTEINIPWLFRLGPDDATVAGAFARDIYAARGLRRVLLVTQSDHDGREGRDAFEKAAREVQGPARACLTVGLENADRDPSRADLEGMQAVVIWTESTVAARLVPSIREVLPSVPIYLCRKAVEGDRSELARPRCRACAVEDSGLWTVQTQEGSDDRRARFVQCYRQRFGADSSVAAAQTYDAVRVLAASLRRSGPNRARLRDVLAGISGFAGVSGVISFDHAGNDTSAVTLVQLK